MDNVAEYQAIVDAEWQILYDKLDRIHAGGAKIVLSKLPIGDVASTSPTALCSVPVEWPTTICDERSRPAVAPF